jgi:ATP-dependent Lhr-like helicase
VLIAAPTGSGKTLTAFLACLDELFGLAADGKLTDETHVLYVSPLKALGNDVQKNLLEPLAQLKARAKEAGVDLPEIRVMVRSGDTTSSERAQMVKKPPHILITTPESLYLYLTADKARADHGLGAHRRRRRNSRARERQTRLALRALDGAPQIVHHQRKDPTAKLQCIGLSATTRPLERLAHFLVGNAETPCELVQVGHVRPWELSLETPEEELSAVPTHEMWGQIYDRLVALSQTHRTMLVFTNTRRLSERLAHDLGERMGHEHVRAHHGSMSRELRLSAEELLKSGRSRSWSRRPRSSWASTSGRSTSWCSWARRAASQ